MRQLPFFVRFTVLTGLLIALALMFDGWDSLRGDYGWRWGYDVPSKIAEWLPILIALMVYVGGCLWLMRSDSRRAWQIIAWGLLGSTILPFIFLMRLGDPFFVQFTRVVSGSASGPQAIAADYEPDELDDALKHWTIEQQRFADDSISIHAALAPPGLPLLYYGAGRVFEGIPPVADAIGNSLRTMQCDNFDIAGESNAELSSAIIGMMSPLWAALAIFPLVWLGRRVSDEQSARWMVLLWALIPGLNVFTPVPNTVFPTLAILCIALLWKSLESRLYAYAFFAGLVASVMTFLNFSVVPLLLFCGLLALGYHLLIAIRNENPPRRWWSAAIGIAFGIGLSMVWMIWLLYGGETPFAMFSTAMNQHLELEREYLPWLVLHLWDYVLFLGLPLMLFSLWLMWRGIEDMRHGNHFSPAILLALCLGLSLLLLDVSGTARGETGRVWQFFFPLSLLTGAAALRGLPKLNTQVLLGTQAFYALAILLFIPTIGTGMVQPPQSPPEIENPQISIETSILFDDVLRLTGFGGRLDNSKNDLVIDLRWQVESRSEEPYYFAVIPVAPDGEPYQESYVFQPFDSDYPVTCWKPGSSIMERVRIPLKSESTDAIPAGEWWLSLSMHDYHDFEPLPVILPDGTHQDTQAGIGPISVDGS